MVHLILKVLTQEMDGAIDHAICHQVTVMPMASHVQKGQIVPRFNCLDLGNAMVAVVSHDQETCYISCQLFLPKENIGHFYAVGIM